MGQPQFLTKQQKLILKKISPRMIEPLTLEELQRFFSQKAQAIAGIGTKH